MAEPLQAGDGPPTSVDRALAPFTDAQTYKNFLYLALAAPLGFAYLFVPTFGFVLGVVLSVVLVGLAVLVATVVGARLLADVERRLANALLGLDLRAPRDVRPASVDGTLEATKRYLEAASTWRGLAFLAIRFWVGVFAIVLLAVVVQAVTLLTTPVRYPVEVELVEVNDTPIVWSIEHLPAALLAVAVGALAVIVFVHVANAVTWVAERIAVSLLDGPVESSRPADPSSSPETGPSADPGSSSETGPSADPGSSSETGPSADPGSSSESNELNGSGG